jgi:hypothetical protein
MARSGAFKKPTTPKTTSRGDSGYLGPPTAVPGPVKQYPTGQRPAGGSRGYTGAKAGTVTKRGTSTPSLSQGTATRRRTVNVSQVAAKKKK